MRFYLYILNRVCGGDCWESSLKLHKVLTDTHWLAESILPSLFINLFICLHWETNWIFLSALMHSFTWNCPSGRKGSHDEGTGSPVVNVQLWETRESIWHRKHSIQCIPALSQSRRTFTNVSLWKFRCWSAVGALQKGPGHCYSHVQQLGLITTIPNVFILTTDHSKYRPTASI